MAAVWRAKDLTLERPVAVKLLFARDDRDKQALVDQFLREARIAAAVEHRNVIHIVDFGSTDVGQPYMVMELLEGDTLGDRIRHDPRLSLEEIVHVMILTLRGLAAVHDAGIIHRDLKPDNIFLKTEANGDLFPKILDFGISRSVEPASGRRSALTTREGIIVGTPEYMSPEQARGIKSVDKRTDVYSAGVILYEALTDELPFQSENVGDLIIQIVTGTAPPVHEVRPNIPEPISQVVSKAMARWPSDRYQDAGEMRQALIAAAEECFGKAPRTLSDRPPTAVLKTAPAIGTVSQQRMRALEFDLNAASDNGPLELASERRPSQGPLTQELLGEPQRRRRRKLMLATIAAVVAGVALGVLALQGEDAPGPDGVPLAPLASNEPAAAPAPPAASTVRLRNVPAEARVMLDGTPQSGDAFEVPNDGRERVIEVLAAGKKPWSTTHPSHGDAVYDVWLVDQPSSATDPRKASAVKKITAKSSTKSPTSPTAATQARPRATAAPKPHKKAPSAIRKLDF